MHIPLPTLEVLEAAAHDRQWKALITSSRMSRAQVPKGLKASELRHFAEDHKNLLEDFKQGYDLIRFVFKKITQA